MFACEFSSQQDQKRALDDGPLNFFRNLVIFDRPLGWQNHTSMSFDDLTIWVQLHNLPLALMHRELLAKVGRQIGVIVEMDAGENGVFLGRFARIRVRININQPISKFIRISTEGEAEDIIVLLVYERLPDFCYACGRIGHTVRDCVDDTVNKDKLEYGTWLRATNYVGGGKGRHTYGSKSASTNTKNQSKEREETHESTAEEGLKAASQDMNLLEDVNLRKLDRKILEEDDTGSPQDLIIDSIPTTDLIQEMTELVQKSITEIPNGSTNNQHEMVGLAGVSHIQKEKKQWKRRARETGMHHLTITEDGANVDVKRKHKVCVEELSPKGHTSLPQKRTKTVSEDALSSFPSVVVALQPRRSQ